MPAKRIATLRRSMCLHRTFRNLTGTFASIVIDRKMPAEGQGFFNRDSSFLFLCYYDMFVTLRKPLNELRILSLGVTDDHIDYDIYDSRK